MTTSETIRSEAEAIENAAADLAYRAGLGVGEWESFLTAPQTHRLIELAEQGAGTWGREPDTLERMKRLHETNRLQKFRELMTLKETIRSQLHLDRIVIYHAGGTVTLTPEQGRKVLGGGELTVVLGKVVVK